MTSQTRILPFGERALLVELADAFSEAAVVQSRVLADLWEAERHGAAVPAYASVLLHYDPETLDAASAERRANELVGALPAVPAPGEATRLIDIPTRYDGPDLRDVAERSGLTVEALADAHSAREYTVYFLGFLPGFAYCGRLDPRIVAPRLDRPRARVPAGAVAVADGQTAVYPFASPGGWRLIGSTDVTLFDATSRVPALLRAGDRIRFVPR